MDLVYPHGSNVTFVDSRNGLRHHNFRVADERSRGSVADSLHVAAPAQVCHARVWAGAWRTSVGVGSTRPMRLIAPDGSDQEPDLCARLASSISRSDCKASGSPSILTSPFSMASVTVIRLPAMAAIVGGSVQMTASAGVSGGPA